VYDRLYKDMTKNAHNIPDILRQVYERLSKRVGERLD